MLPSDPTAIQSGIYEHFKSSEESQKLYAVFGVVPDVNGKLPPVVLYCALYVPHAGERVYRILLDPEDGFLSSLDRPGYKGSRFKLLYSMERSVLESVVAMAQHTPFPSGRAETLAIIEPFS